MFTYRPISSLQLIKQSRRRAGLFYGTWISFILLNCALGTLLPLASWINVAGFDIRFSFPFLLSTIAVLWFGWSTAVSLSFATSLTFAIFHQVPFPNNVILSLADGLGITIFWLFYQAFPRDISLRSHPGKLVFLFSSILASIGSSFGAFLETYSPTQNFSQQMFELWQGWWVGSMIQNLFVAGPLLYTFSPAVERFKLRIFHENVFYREKSVSLPGVVIIAAGFIALFFVTLRFNLDQELISAVNNGNVAERLNDIIAQEWIVTSASLGIFLLVTGLGIILLSRFTNLLEEQVKQRTDALQQSQQQYRLLLENAPDAIMTIDDSGTILEANFGAEQVTGVSRLSLRGRKLTEWVQVSKQEDFLKNLHKLEREEQIYHWIFHLLDKEQQVRWLEANATKISSGLFLLIARDITEKRIMDEKIKQSQRMETVATLAGGIAHDFNNLLTGVLGFSSFLLEQTLPEHPHRRPLEQIQNSAKRAALLTSQLLTFSRQTVLQKRPVDLNALVTNTQALLTNSMPPQIQLQCQLSPGLPWVEADETQMSQVLVNLCLNARDAIQGKGDILLQTQVVHISPRDLKTFPEAKVQDYVVLRVRDTGTGIPETVKQRLFEPFYTTKELGKGIGLGLSIVYSIVKAFDGFVEVTTEMNQGSCFSIYLPASSQMELPMQEAPRLELQDTKQKTILIVDDERLILDVATEVLSNQGFQVISCEGPETALQIYQNKYRQIDLVLLDYAMPRMNGYQLFQKMRQINPNVKGLISSGFLPPEEEQDFVSDHQLRFVSKPYDVPTLLKVLQEALMRSSH